MCAPAQAATPRFFAELPEPGTVVWVRADRATEAGVYVTLLGYGSEGLLLYSELSRRRRTARAALKLAAPGKEFAASVVRVDAARGYIDLSRKRMSPLEEQRCRALYSAAHQTYKLIEQACADCENAVTVAAAYEAFGWQLADRAPDKTPLEALALAASAPESFFRKYEVPSALRPALADRCARHFAAQMCLVEVRFDLVCLAVAGVDAIRAALRAGEELAAKNAWTVEIAYLSAPLYSAKTVDHPARGNERLAALCAAIEREIYARSGTFVLHTPQVKPLDSD